MAHNQRSYASIQVRDCVGVVLAGGTGSRLFPCTKVTNKHLLPIGNMPMIFYPIEKLVSAGITEILIVTGTEHMGDFLSLLGSGKEFGCSFSYKVQDEAGGIAQALALAERFAGSGPLCVILGDNIFEDDISPMLDDFTKQPTVARLALKQVPDAERFGVATIVSGEITKIEEKPHEPTSDYAVTGIYCYPADVFSKIRGLKPSARGEYEITDVNEEYLREGRLAHMMLSGYWSDAGTFASLEKANELVRASAPKLGDHHRQLSNLPE